MQNRIFVRVLLRSARLVIRSSSFFLRYIYVFVCIIAALSVYTHTARKHVGSKNIDMLHIYLEGGSRARV